MFPTMRLNKNILILDPNLLDDPDHLQQEGLVRDLGKYNLTVNIRFAKLTIILLMSFPFIFDK